MKFSVILSNLGSCSDRYMSGGYSEPFTLSGLLERAALVKGIAGIELIGGWNLTEETAPVIKKALDDAGLSAVAVIPDHFGKPLWGKGAFTNPDPEIRKAAFQETMATVRAARAVGCGLISIWNGQDGFDYPLQADYDRAWEWLVEGVRSCAAGAPDMKFSLEYKPKEPRNHSFVSNVYASLLICDEIGLPNVGVTIDTGHASEAYENLAQSAVLAMKKNRLFHFHINDNYGYWDDDMMTGSVHTIEYVELFWWLKRIGYDGYISIDQYPYREESLAAAQESIDWMHTFDRASSEIDSGELQAILDRNDAVASTRLMRKLLFRG